MQAATTIGVIDQDGKKHRFGTLGVMVHYQEWLVQIQQAKLFARESRAEHPQTKGKTEQSKSEPQKQQEKSSTHKPCDIEDELNRRMDELRQARQQGRERDDEAER